MSGFAIIPSGARGHCSNTVDFTGARGQTSYEMMLSGAGEGPFTLSSGPDAVYWSPCGGGSAIMNMNTQCSISPTEKPALIAVRCASDEGERDRD